MNWEAVMENIKLWYVRVAQFYLIQTLILYLIACTAAGHPLGPGKYVGFLYHLFLYR